MSGLTSRPRPLRLDIYRCVDGLCPFAGSCSTATIDKCRSMNVFNGLQTPSPLAEYPPAQAANLSNIGICRRSIS